MLIAARFVIAMSLIAVTRTIAAETYDLLILGGRVMDPETNLDAVRNVGVGKGQRTSPIGQ